MSQWWAARPGEDAEGGSDAGSGGGRWSPTEDACDEGVCPWPDCPCWPCWLPDCCCWGGAGPEGEGPCDDEEVPWAPAETGAMLVYGCVEGGLWAVGGAGEMLWGVDDGRGWPRGDAPSSGEPPRGEPGVMGAPMGVLGPLPLCAAFISFLYLDRRFWNQILIWGRRGGLEGWEGGGCSSLEEAEQDTTSS